MRIRTHTNPFNYATPMPPLDLQEIFPGYGGDLDVEIGFGRGFFLREWAKKHPERHMIGVDVRKHIVPLAEQKAILEGVQNVKWLHGNGEIFLRDALPESCIQRLFVFHPDPWLKKTHHKRRLINAKFLELAKRSIKPGGHLYLSTDVKDLWDYMQVEIQAFKGFGLSEDIDFWQNEYRTEWHDLSHQRDRPLLRAAFIRN